MQAGDDQQSSEAVGLSAAQSMFVSCDADRLHQVVARDASLEDQGPGSFWESLDAFVEAIDSDDFRETMRLREILFYSPADYADLQRRFAHKTDFWTEAQLPDQMTRAATTGICVVVFDELRDGAVVDQEVYVFVISRASGQNKVVFAAHS